MKRREVLQVLPLSVASLRLFGQKPDSPLSKLDPEKTAEIPAAQPGRPMNSPLLAQVKPHNGAPTLFLNGRPTFPGIYWVSGPEPNRWDFAAQARRNADAGIHIYAFDVGKGREWVGPATDPAHPFDFSTVEARFGRILEADPQALFHLRIYLETGHGDWWEKTYPGECEVTSEGKRNGMSFASKVWRDQVKEFLRAYADHFRRIGLSERVLAYQVGTGHTGEWVKGESSMYWPCGDYSEPMRRHFRAWLRGKYKDSIKSLPSAWARPSLTFDSAEVPSMLPSESVRLHGKLCLIEDDTRTHSDPQDPNYGQAANLSESVAILRRNFAGVVSRGQGIWWASWKMDTVKEPAFLSLLKAFEKLGTFALSLDRKPVSEVAVFIDDESFFYQSVKNSLDIPLIFQQRLWGLPRLGAPFDVYLLGDLLEGNLPPYKLCIFLNVFHLDEKRRAALKKAVRRDQRTSLWIYAPGLMKDDVSLENMTDLTGFRFGMGEQPWGPLVHITDSGHPITKDLDQALFWGTNSKLAPLFYIDDSEARVLGQVVYSQGNCKPGFAVKTFPEWTSVYSAAPNLPAPVLRGISRFAGVHIYSDAGDVLYASRQLLGVHTVRGGNRTFKLPRPAEVVHDLFENMSIANNTAEFEITLPRASTSLFYTGDAQLLRLI